MKFFSKDLCEKLTLLSFVCKSENCWYQLKNGEWFTYHCFVQDLAGTDIIPAFCIYDFLNDEDYSIHNCELFFKKGSVQIQFQGQKILCNSVSNLRVSILEAKDQEKFIFELVINLLNE